MAHRHEHDHSQNSEYPVYSQPSLEGLEAPEPAEVTFDNCVIVSRPLYTKSGKTAQWQCGIHAPPDMFHQDRDEFIVAHATGNARFANSLRLMPGDRVNITGQLSQQELSLGNGDKKLVNHLVVSAIVVVEKAVRKSITVYEQKRGR